MVSVVMRYHYVDWKLLPRQVLLEGSNSSTALQASIYRLVIAVCRRK
jgi:hypothetical protein